MPERIDDGKPYMALAGFPARDTKLRLDGTVEEALGGALFSALAMAPLADPLGLRVAPIMNVGRDTADEAHRLLARAGCSLEGVRVVNEATQHSIITFTGPNERWERVEGRSPSLGPDDIAPWLGAREIVVNFITGVEMELATFRWLREAYAGPIVIDYHTLALATLPDGRREPRRRPDWAAWLEVPDVVQMNRDEAQALAGHDLADEAACAEFARHLLALGPRAVVITLAKDGAVGAERALAAHGRTRFAVHRVPAHQPDELVDTVGCGDVFLAALAVGWLEWSRLEPALRLATTAAGDHCAYPGLERTDTLRGAWLKALAVAARA